MTRKVPAKTLREAKLRILLAGSRDRDIERRLRAAAPELELIGARRGKPPNLVMMAYEDYQHLRDELEDKEAEKAFVRTRDEEMVPVEIEHRGMTLAALKSKVGLSRGYLSDLENGKRVGPIGTLRKIAHALGLELDDLT
jgi:hypothetical protein